MSESLITRGNYKQKYISDNEKFLQDIIQKKCVPIQLEIQPGREKGKPLCWMKCPYCYGAVAENSKKKLAKERYLNLLDEVKNGPNGGINKLIYAGYATDPLNYEHIDDLLEKSYDNLFITGIHTKLLRFSKRFVSLVGNENIVDASYITISVDAGIFKNYNLTHGLDSNVNILSKIYNNINIIMKNRSKKLDVTTTYLLTTFNSSKKEIEQSIKDIRDLGVQTHRFSFPQVPRGYNFEQKNNIFVKNRTEMINEIKEIIYKYTRPNSTILTVVDPDKELAIDKERYLPCFARFVHPTVGYDGYLYHCSESASPDFHSFKLGNLEEKNFWDLYYDYDKEKILKDFKSMEDKKCMCSRNLFAVNKSFEKSVMGTDYLDKMQN